MDYGNGVGKMNLNIFTNKKPPYICTPLTGGTSEEVLNQLETILPQAPDLIEWRADFFTDLADTNQVLEVVRKIKGRTDLPLLFTIRAEHEGGEKITLTEKEKVALFVTVCEQTEIDFLDYETSNEDKYIQKLRETAKQHRKRLILSYHNFTNTPDDNTELIGRAKQAEAYGADIVKLAVMPKSQADVLHLLEATRKMDELLDVPVITMSMGDIGALSRIIGWAYGSIITFGVGVEHSAPGQMPIKKLREAIQVTQQLVPNWK